MEIKRIRTMLEIIEELVNEEGLTWRDKQQMVLNDMSKDEQLALEEFTSWFEPAK